VKAQVHLIQRVLTIKINFFYVALAYSTPVVPG